LCEDYRLKGLENRVVRKTFVSKTGEVTEDENKLNNKEIFFANAATCPLWTS
jgi:hypothetical protein